jgi:NAD+ synthase
MKNSLEYGFLSKMITKWIEKYAKENGIKTLVVGVSGGIDSAVVSTLCALTDFPTILVNIPIKSNKTNTDLSALHCKHLSTNYQNVKVITVDISDEYDMLSKKLGEATKDSRESEQVKKVVDLANANMKSRMRMLTLYRIAGVNSGIVVGTGNKVEDFGIGFFTKYGDGGVDISPIADLTKTQVRELGRSLGVCKEIIEAKPTDGLWEDDRTDESQIGASYEELEWAMWAIDNDKCLKEMTERQIKVIEIYRDYNTRNNHKMIPIPVFKVEHE